MIAQIDPDTASKLLDQNRRNRKVRRTRVELYARDMHRWQLNGQTIVFTSDGTLLDGQHRLLACVMSAAAFETYIIGDVVDEAFESIDYVLVRGLDDVLGAEGESSARMLAAAAMVGWKIEFNHQLGAGAGTAHPTRADLIEWIERHQGVKDHLALADRMRKSPVRYGRAGLAACLSYLMSEVDPSLAESFWARLDDGVGLYPGHPVLALRNALIGQIGSTKKLAAEDVAAMTIKAWNAYRKRESIKFLRWRRAGDKPEKFPVIS